jgi:hypothetical protein
MIYPVHAGKDYVVDYVVEQRIQPGFENYNFSIEYGILMNTGLVLFIPLGTCANTRTLKFSDPHDQPQKPTMQPSEITVRSRPF